MKLILHAPNVHVGGGLVLLKSLIESVDPGCFAYLTLDARIGNQIAIPGEVPFQKFNATVSGRLAAELVLKKHARTAGSVLCFGALPPLFRLDAHVMLFAQNLSIVEAGTSTQFGWKVGARIFAERLWFRALASHVDEYIAQTSSVADKLRTVASARQMVRVLSFLDIPCNVPRRLEPSEADENVPKRYDFVYVASGIAHKNHKRLVLAWQILAQDGIFPSLCLTLDLARNENLWNWISSCASESGLKIENVGHIEHSATPALYRSSRALIFPSTMESVGLPLIEARRLGLPIVASELDFVRNTVDPEESFDPASETSIARAVKRFLGRREKDATFLGPQEFVAALLSRTA